MTWDLRRPTTPRQLGSDFDDFVTDEAAADTDLAVEVLLPGGVAVRGNYRIVTGDAHLRVGTGNAIGRLQLIPRDNPTLESLAELVDEFDATWCLTEQSRADWVAVRSELAASTTDGIITPPSLGPFAYGLEGTAINGVTPSLTIRIIHGGASTYTVVRWDPHTGSSS